MWPGYREDTYFGDLKFPVDPVPTIGILHGKSNFPRWHSNIQPVLLSNPHSQDLILGTWTQPRFPTSCTTEEQTTFDEELREWHAANTATCRFIRATLAPNVVPFVRQYTTAKTLFFNLVWLYGEDAGIDTQGGPPIPVNAQISNVKRGRAGLLAALEAKRTLDHLPLVSMTFRPPSPATLNDTHTCSSSSSSTQAATIRDESKKLQPTVAPEPVPEYHRNLIRSFERARIFSDPDLNTIHEHEEPHPGRRVPSGYAIGFDLNSGGDQSGGSISPFTLSESDGGYEDDHIHLEDVSINDQTSRSKKRQASVELEGRPPKASIASILKTVKAGKTRKRDKFPFSFPLRRLNVDNEKGKSKAVTS